MNANSEKRKAFVTVAILCLILSLITITIVSPSITQAQDSDQPAIIDTSNTIQATKGLTHTNFLPAISKPPAVAGHGLIFVSDRAEATKYDIYSMNLDGSNLKRLTHFAVAASYTKAQYFLPQWSPDGTQIAAQMGGVLYLIQPDGSYFVTLMEDPHLIVNGVPQWSPDGSKIAFLVHNCNNPSCTVRSSDDSGLWVIDVQTQAVTVLLNDVVYSDSLGVHWTPDGQSVIVGKPLNCCINQSQVRIAYLDGSPPLTWYQYTVGAIAVSPNGQRIASTSLPNLYTSDLAGNNVTTIFVGQTGPIPRNVIWRPDGQKLAFDTRDSINTSSPIIIHVAKTDGSQSNEIVSYDSNSTIRLWGWHPNGLQLFYNSDVNRETFKFDIYMVNNNGSNPVNLTANSAGDDLMGDYRP